MHSLAEMVRELCAANLLTRAQPVPMERLPWAALHGVLAAIVGDVCVEGRDLPLCLGLTHNFPGRLPKVFVLDENIHGRVPHVFADGHICFQEAEGILLDRHSPVDVAREALDRAVETLRRGLSGDNSSDFIEELALYWHGDVEGISFFEADDRVKEIRRVLFPLTGVWAFVSDRAQARQVLRPEPALKTAEFTALIDSLITKTWSRGLYIPIKEVPRPLDPFPVDPWKPEQIEQFIFENLTPAQRKKVDALTRGMNKRSTFLIMRVPRPRGGDYLVGVRFENIRGGHPLSLKPGDATVAQFRLERRDAGYLLPRAGGASDLRQKRVVLVGCGAIGGQLALELIRCGIGQLTLVDPDVLRPENAHRHVLGMPPLLLQPNKALLLAAEIERRYPGSQIKGLATTIEHAIEVGSIVPTQYDLVVSATGDPNVDRSLNDRLYTAESRPASLFTWLEPLGIGGHAVTFAPQEHGALPGCFDCLFTPRPLDPAPVLENHASFAAPGQVFTRELAGCGNAFTPYSSLDALRTAEIAARLIIDVLQGRVHGPLLRSWKGSGEAFRAAGFRTAPRFEIASETLESGCTDVAMTNCRVCGAK